MESRYDNIQRLLYNIGDSGCFFLSLLSVAEEVNNGKVDLIDTVKKAMDKQWLKNDYTVLNDIALLKYLTNKKVSKRVETDCGVLKSNEYSIMKWYNPRTNYDHFRRRYFDVYHDSITVKEGYVMCYYIYTFGGK